MLRGLQVNLAFTNFRHVQQRLHRCHSMQACQLVLEAVHALWEPLEGRVKDYIASPKPNGYQSLHATVRLPAITFDLETQPSPSSAPPQRYQSGHAAPIEAQPEEGPSAAEGQGNFEQPALVGPAMEVQIRTRGKLFSCSLHMHRVVDRCLRQHLHLCFIHELQKCCQQHLV